MVLASDRLATGIRGLDVMLGGGLPEGRVVLLLGGPGTGKTIFCSQFLHWGVVNTNEDGVYLSLDENKLQYYKEMYCFGWDFQELENQSKFVFVDGSSSIRTPKQAKVGRIPVGGRELGLVSLLEMIETSVQKIGARRVVLDSLSGLIFRFPKLEERRLALLDIIEGLNATKTTCLVTSEVLAGGGRRLMQPEEYLVHGVIELQTLRNGGRMIQLLKMRETKIDTKPRPYSINENGIEVSWDQDIYALEEKP